MKGEMITLKGGQEAKVEAEVAVSITGRTIVIRLLKLVPQNTFLVTRNNFIVSDDSFKTTFKHTEESMKMFMKTVMEESFK